MRSILQNNKGFTLIEATVAFVVLAIGLIALLSLQGAALRMNDKNQIAEIGKDILVSEIDQIMPLSNLQLRTPTNVGQADTRAALNSPYTAAPYSTFTGVDTTPSGFDYIRFNAVSRSILNDAAGTSGKTINYLVKISIDKKYLLQDVLARGRVTVYWPVTKRGLDFLETTFYVQRK
jgi:type II secretory pathway pseudopilin PulG